MLVGLREDGIGLVGKRSSHNIPTSAYGNWTKFTGRLTRITFKDSHNNQETMGLSQQLENKHPILPVTGVGPEESQDVVETNCPLALIHVAGCHPHSLFVSRFSL